LRRGLLPLSQVRPNILKIRQCAGRIICHHILQYSIHFRPSWGSTTTQTCPLSFAPLPPTQWVAVFSSPSPPRTPSAPSRPFNPVRSTGEPAPPLFVFPPVLGDRRPTFFFWTQNTPRCPWKSPHYRLYVGIIVI